MTNPSQARSVKISDDERTGWSSERPRKGGPDRPADISTRCRVLKPSYAMRYSPGSLLVIVSASKAERDRFAERLIENKNSLLSLDKVRGLLTGRVAADELEARAAELLHAAVLKRLAAGDTTVVAVDTIGADEREPFVRAAAAQRRPRHIVLIEAGKDSVDDDNRAALNDLRRRLDAGELGQEGFQTAMRLGGESLRELKKIAFQPAARDD
jgi:hypothetical protein